MFLFECDEIFVWTLELYILNVHKIKSYNKEYITTN